MPYKLRDNCVVKADSGKVVKCHPDKTSALAHLRALEANVADDKVQGTGGKAFQGKLTQQSVSYTPLSPQIASEACANCRWFMNPGCFIVESWEPEPILATGYCDRHEANPPPPPTINTDNPMPVVIVEPPMDDMDSAEMALPTSRRGLKELVMKWFKPTLAKPPAETQERAFTVFKGKDNGEWYWLARHTGKWVDREDEILADKAHDAYVARVQKGLVPMPELWTWHKKGTMHGVADFVWKSGGFVLALGHLVGTQEQKDRAAKYYQEHEVKLSHMFKYPQNGKKKKVYWAYNTVEITTLPPGAEAFPYTTFEGIGNMPFTKEQEQQIRGIGGDEMWQRALAADTKAMDESAKMDAAGIASKTHDNFEGSTIPQDDDANKAIVAAQKDMNERLAKVEKLLTVPDTLAAVDANLKALMSKLDTMQTTSAQALEKANANEKKLLEYQAVAPPASKSNDTLINDAEKSMMERIVAAAKVDNNTSLIGSLFGSTPVINGAVPNVPS